MKDNDDKDILRIDDAAERAASLLDGLMNGDLSEGRLDELRAWLKSGVNEDVKYDALEGIISGLEENTAPGKEDYERLYKTMVAFGLLPGGKRQAPAVKLRRPWYVKALPRIAAVIIPAAVIFGVGYFIARAPRAEPVQQIAQTTVSVSADQKREITLPDGSTVKLEAGSEISYNDNFADRRHVELSGEAVFDVMKITDETGVSLPFDVSTGHLTVNVQGTVFRVSGRIGAEHTTVSLYEGSVSVEVDSMLSLLGRGERLSLNNYTHEYEIGLIPASEMLANGERPLLRFKEASLANLITAMQTNYGVAFEVAAGIDAAKGLYTFNFEGVGLERALNLLNRSNSDLQFVLKGDKVTVITK